MDELKEAFGAANVVTGNPRALHGWRMADMPLQNGMPIYGKPDTEHAWPGSWPCTRRRSSNPGAHLS